MTFDANTIAMLQQPLDPSRVKTRQGSGGMTLSYVEGYDVIDMANEIFGFDGWNMRVDSVTFQPHMGEHGGYIAVVDLTIQSRVGRGDGGVGLVAGRQGEPARSDAHEVAVKGAITDAMKRAFRTFGNQFGNSLYDKESPLHTSNGATPSRSSTPSRQAPQPRTNGASGSGFDAGDSRKATDKQLNFLRRVADDNGVSDLDGAAVRLFGYGLDRLGKMDASKLIDAIKAGEFAPAMTGADASPADAWEDDMPF